MPCRKYNYSIAGSSRCLIGLVQPGRPASSVDQRDGAGNANSLSGLAASVWGGGA